MVGVRICALLLLLAACGGQSASRAEAVADHPITVADDDGRTVTLPHAPQRILSLVPNAT
jgi:ABC-type Fe3+-hydroxamate transport system substrate-binding protein